MRPFDYSFEFFPPKTDAAGRKLDKALDELEILNPSFVSITYGAGGTTRERTFNTVNRILKQRTISPAAHLTCVGATRNEIDAIVKEYLDAGIDHIVALRGDPPGGVDGKYQPHENGYAYASDLVAGIRELSSDVEISVSAYPELHPESTCWEAELDNLKRKVDAGATRALTQFFFEPDRFLNFVEKASKAGIDIPIIPGIMLQPNFEGLARMSEMCGVEVPENWRVAYEKVGEDKEARKALTIDFGTELVCKLRKGGVTHFHFYTLNSAPIAWDVIRNVRGVARKQAA